jgi:adenine phosphoribosyltransferase
VTAAVPRAVHRQPSAAGKRTFVTMAQKDATKAMISDSIRGIPDFPKKGILFWDVTTLMLEHKAFQATIDLLQERYNGEKVDVVAGK